MRTPDDLAPSGGVVRWGQGVHAFELRSLDSAVLERAALVTRPWTVVSSDAPAMAAWTIMAGPGADEWTIRRDGASDVVVRGDRSRAVRTVESLAVIALTESAYDLLTLHAALVARGGFGVLILGAGGAGKSTLGSALWQRGFELLGDDIAIVDLETLDATPAPRRVSLRSPSRDVIDRTVWDRVLDSESAEPTPEGVVFHPHEITGTERVTSARLTTFVFLNRAGSGPPPPGMARRIPAASAALALLPASNLIRRHDTWTVIARLSPLAARVPAYDLARAPIDTMCGAVEAVLRESGC